MTGNKAAKLAYRRRILVHTPEPDAGAARYVSEFVKSLAAAGEHVALLCPANFSYLEEVSAAGVEIIAAPARETRYAALPRRLWRNLVFAFGALRRFASTVKLDDIVHFQFALHLGLALSFFFLARLKGAATVLTVHDPLPHRWVLPRPLRWLELAALSIGYSLSDRLIVHNQAGRRILVDRFDLPEQIIKVVPHGPLHILPATGVSEESPNISKPFRLLAFGSIRGNKGLHLSIAAVQSLRSTNSNRSICLTIAGCVPNLAEQEYWQSCLRLIEEKPDGINVVERVIADSEISSLFASHDAVLLPYSGFFSESGVGMLALSQRRPILATAAGGLGEILQKVDCGFLIESGSVEGVSAAIQTAIGCPPENLERKSRDGYHFASQTRSWSNIARQTQLVYNQVNKRSSLAQQHVILHTPEPGSSTALYIESLSKALVSENVPLRVVCPANHQALETLLQNPCIGVYSCVARGTRTNVSVFTKIAENLHFVLSSLTTLARATKPRDIVHFQYILHLPFGLMFLACARLRRAHVTFTVHDPLPHKFLLPAFLHRFEMAAHRWAYHSSDVLIVHSEAGKRTLLDKFQVPAAKVEVIVHGPYELLKKPEPCRETDRLEVLFFGSLRENKAPHLAIQAVQQLAAEGVRIRLTIAGQVVNRNEEAYWAHCKTLVDPVSGVVRLFEQFTPDEALCDLFTNAHCFLLPYQSFASDSGVAYMALANAKPIISTTAGGLGWLLENSRGGIAISEASVEGVVASLRLAIGLGPSALERMGRIGSEWVLANCGWPRVARETRDVYGRWIPALASAASNTSEGQPKTAAIVPMEAVS